MRLKLYTVILAGTDGITIKNPSLVKNPPFFSRIFQLSVFDKNFTWSPLMKI